MSTPIFKNGFDSYIETFFQLTCLIQNNYDENWNLPNNSRTKQTQDAGGHIALCSLAKELTEEFEARYEVKGWTDLDWYETLEAFFTEKNELHPL